MPAFDVADRPAGAHGRLAHPLRAVSGVSAGRRRLLDQLLVAALDRAVALAEVDHVAVLVAQDLDLDVARPLDELLEVDARVAERGRGLVPAPS